MIKEYRSQIHDYILSQTRKPSVRKASKQIGIFNNTGTRKLSHYGLFNPDTHSFNEETSKLPVSVIFDKHCSDPKLLILYNELFSKYNTDIKMKELQIKKFISNE